MVEGRQGNLKREIELDHEEVLRTQEELVSPQQTHPEDVQQQVYSYPMPLETPREPLAQMLFERYETPYPSQVSPRSDFHRNAPPHPQHPTHLPQTAWASSTPRATMTPRPPTTPRPPPASALGPRPIPGPISLQRPRPIPRPLQEPRPSAEPRPIPSLSLSRRARSVIRAEPTPRASRIPRASTVIKDTQTPRATQTHCSQLVPQVSETPPVTARLTPLALPSTIALPPISPLPPPIASATLAPVPPPQPQLRTTASPLPIESPMPWTLPLHLLPRRELAIPMSSPISWRSSSAQPPAMPHIVTPSSSTTAWRPISTPEFEPSPLAQHVDRQQTSQPTSMAWRPPMSLPALPFLPHLIPNLLPEQIMLLKQIENAIIRYRHITYLHVSHQFRLHRHRIEWEQEYEQYQQLHRQQQQQEQSGQPLQYQELFNQSQQQQLSTAQLQLPSPPLSAVAAVQNPPESFPASGWPAPPRPNVPEFSNCDHLRSGVVDNQVRFRSAQNQNNELRRRLDSMESGSSSPDTDNPPIKRERRE